MTTVPATRVPMDPRVADAVARLSDPATRIPGLHRAAGQVPAAGERCMFSATVSSDQPAERVLLTCDRRPGHPGPHWDETDNVAWKYGCPPSEQGARGA